MGSLIAVIYHYKTTRAFGRSIETSELSTFLVSSFRVLRSLSKPSNTSGVLIKASFLYGDLVVLVRVLRAYSEPSQFCKGIEEAYWRLQGLSGLSQNLIGVVRLLWESELIHIPSWPLFESRKINTHPQYSRGGCEGVSWLQSNLSWICERQVVGRGCKMDLILPFLFLYKVGFKQSRKISELH